MISIGSLINYLIAFVLVFYGSYQIYKEIKNKKTKEEAKSEDKGLARIKGSRGLILIILALIVLMIWT
jgi:putative Mn2+ efflux pump MntP